MVKDEEVKLLHWRSYILLELCKEWDLSFLTIDSEHNNAGIAIPKHIMHCPMHGDILYNVLGDPVAIIASNDFMPKKGEISKLKKPHNPLRRNIHWPACWENNGADTL